MNKSPDLPQRQSANSGGHESHEGYHDKDKRDLMQLDEISKRMRQGSQSGDSSAPEHVVPRTESTEARLNHALALIEMQSQQINQLTLLLQKQPRPVFALRAANAAVRAKGAVGNIYGNPNMRATSNGQMWMRQIRRSEGEPWETVEAKPLTQVSSIARDASYQRMRELQRYARSRSNPFIDEQSRIRRVAAFAMGPDVYFNANGARDELFGNESSSRSRSSSSGERRAGGYVSPNYTVYAPAPRTGVGRPDLMQNELKNYYASQMDGGQLEERFRDLRGGEYADQVFQKLAQRRSQWGRHPGWKYGDLAWARSQFEFVAKADKQRIQFDNYRKEYAGKKPLAEIAVPLSGDPYQQVMIKIPRELDRYGKEGYVLLQPNSLQQFWDSKSIGYANDAGIDFIVDKWPDGRARGVRVKFTKPGDYTVGGKKVEVREKVIPAPVPPGAILTERTPDDTDEQDGKRKARKTA